MQDLVHNRFDEIEHCSTKVDLLNALKELLQEGHISLVDIDLVKMFSAGFTIMELETAHPNPKDRLIYTFGLLEQRSQYLDDSILARGLRKHPRFMKIRDALIRQMVSMSNTFD